MRKLFAKAALPMLAVVLPLTSCEQIEEVIVSQPRVSIEGAGMPTQQECKVRFTPSEDALSYVYALGTVEDAEDFSVGIMDGMVTVDGNEANEVLFSELTANNEYCVFARAFDEGGEPGPVSTYLFKTNQDNFKLTTQYLTDCSAGIKIEYVGTYSRVDCYLGNAEDKEEFLAGNLKDTSLFDRAYTEFYTNNFDLSQNTEYVLYVRGFDRYNTAVDYREFQFTTLKEGDCPKVEMETAFVNIYKSDLIFTANDKTGNILTMCSTESSEGMIAAKRGDIIGTMTASMADRLYGVVTTAAPCQERTYHNDMIIDDEFIFYTIATDKSGSPVGLYRYKYTTPSFNENAPEGKVEIVVSDIKNNGAKYTFKCDENVFAFLYGTVDADWYDNFKETSEEWTETYIHLYLMQAGRFAYKDDLVNGEYTYTEMGAYSNPNKRYYAVCAQVNENGYYKGFLPAVFEEYKTL